MPYSPFQPTLTNTGQGALGLEVLLSAPNERLASSVFAFVQVQVKQSTVYPIVPDGTNILFFSPCRQSFGGTQQSILEVPLTMARGEYFGIWFYPGAMRRFFNVDISEVTNQVQDLDFFSEPKLPNLGEQLYTCKNFSERIALCETLLLKRVIDRPLPAKFTAALSAIYQSYGQCSVKRMAETIGWSHRHLNRQFLLHTGLTVKAFAQTVRMNEYLKRCYQQVSRPLHHGLDLGFYDHSHLIKTTKQHNLDGLSPTAKVAMSNFYNPSN